MQPTISDCKPVSTKYIGHVGTGELTRKHELNICYLCTGIGWVFSHAKMKFKIIVLSRFRELRSPRCGSCSPSCVCRAHSGRSRQLLYYKKIKQIKNKKQNNLDEENFDNQFFCNLESFFDNPIFYATTFFSMKSPFP